MSHMLEPTLEFFVEDSYMNITKEQEAEIVKIMEQYRDGIEYSMDSDYDAETMSWRDYRNSMWSTYEGTLAMDKIDAVLGGYSLNDRAVTVKITDAGDVRDWRGAYGTRMWEVWTEGYQATGEHQRAVHHGSYAGDTFQDALVAFKESLEDENIKKLVNLEKGTFWGCRFFDNETEARKSFG